jgi:dodecin
MLQARIAAYSHPFKVALAMLGSEGRRHLSYYVIPNGRTDMAMYDVIQLIGTSSESWEKAAASAVEQASKSLRDLRVAEVVELDMQLDAKGKVEAYRAKVKLSFKYEPRIGPVGWVS